MLSLVKGVDDCELLTSFEATCHVQFPASKWSIYVLRARFVFVSLESAFLFPT